MLGAAAAVKNELLGGVAALAVFGFASGLSDAKEQRDG
jgi:hypothetical protein